MNKKCILIILPLLLSCSTNNNDTLTYDVPSFCSQEDEKTIKVGQKYEKTFDDLTIYSCINNFDISIENDFLKVYCNIDASKEIIDNMVFYKEHNDFNNDLYGFSLDIIYNSLQLGPTTATFLHNYTNFEGIVDLQINNDNNFSFTIYLAKELIGKQSFDDNKTKTPVKSNFVLFDLSLQVVANDMHSLILIYDVSTESYFDIACYID